MTINTSMRSHGKWGDFLVAIIPLSWCGNILINSNFILRMLEWQNESSLFVVRIQGKQWYWSYKYNADTNYRLNNVFINVGNNNWLKTTTPSNTNFNAQNSISSFIYDYEFKQIHKGIIQKLYPNKYYLNKFSLLSNVYKNYLPNNNTSPIKIPNSIVNNYKVLNFRNVVGTLTGYTGNRFNFNKGTVNNWKILNGYQWNTLTTKINYKNWYVSLNNTIEGVYTKKLNKISSSFFNKKVKHNDNFNLFFFNSVSKNNLYEMDKFDDTFVASDNFRAKTSKFPIKINKGIINKHNLNTLNTLNSLNTNIFFSYKVGKLDIGDKQAHVEQFWGFRQKRYKKLRSYSFSQNTKYDTKTYQHLGNFSKNDNFNKAQLYTSVKNNKYKNEMIPVTLAKRLLRTKRTLVLPVHINITLITNSYDVVHSWFVPGLGLKVDCVPGRSTHHSLYIDNVGFYYGQCAEICGRYHHHMPIRVCAIPFEHFMLWWQTKGLPRMYRSNTLLKNKTILLDKFKY